MRAAEIFTVRRVASPLLDLGSWIHATVDMNGPITNDPVGFVEGDNFTFHFPPLPRNRHSHNRFDSNHTLRKERGAARRTHRTPRILRGDEASLLSLSPEPAEVPFLLRVRDVDHTHRQLGESVSASQGSPEGVDVCHVHPRASTPQSHRQRVQVASGRVFAGRPAERAHAAGRACRNGCESASASGGRDHRMLDDRRTDLSHPAAYTERNFLNRLRGDTADAGDRADRSRPDGLQDGEEPRIA